MGPISYYLYLLWACQMFYWTVLLSLLVTLQIIVVSGFWFFSLFPLGSALVEFVVLWVFFFFLSYRLMLLFLLVLFFSLFVCVESCGFIEVESSVADMENFLVNIYFSIMFAGHVQQLAFGSLLGSNHLHLFEMKSCSIFSLVSSYPRAGHILVNEPKEI